MVRIVQVTPLTDLLLNLTKLQLLLVLGQKEEIL